MNRSEDLEFLRSLDFRSECGRYIFATPCVRADWLVDGPLSKRPGQLDTVLEHAMDLMADRFSFYGGEMDFAHSRGRKPKASDIAQPGMISEIMAKSESRSKEEKAARMKHLREQGLSPDPANFIAKDSGTIGLTDAFPLQSSGCHFQALGFGSWRMTLSFSLDLYEEKANEILSLIDALFATGVPETGHFGFALNNEAGDINFDYVREFKALTKRFELLSPISAGRLNWSNTFNDGVGLYPISSWTYHDKDLLTRLGACHRDIRGLEKDVYEIIESEHGFLIKLFPEPILGERMHNGDLAPADAVGKLLTTAMKRSNLASFCGISVSSEIADRKAWYMRFASGL